ncbi:MAG: bifunctional (p)ppGpp synthetase/guanosine-3',5'-bis(diphosphate) 3'-pyrophosphohydrolase [Xanthomonadales bacterium]|nr:bifunctional (p)ppGpp synthetase/guanosine-3',5'-bis(diphosphate) 3'-pyrophosphohydrolase [Xanthomonadales bacterium]MCE7931328.1 bifunctional (p)ppGpp synthetase/guanosine-3',5'-bis(diphosphate) 3'-pyrophosphohydrolase [Xanthomonadales bacterium PRO6]
MLPHFMLELRQLLENYLSAEQVRQVERAFAFSERAHRGQNRKSGDPYITHPVAVARILAEMHLDAETLQAAILHDTIEDTSVTKNTLLADFGETVADLVDGVTKLDKVQFASRETATAESFRKMLLAMARDLRVILIKLADRLHNMRTLESMSADGRRRIARETLDVYAPIAQRLGMNKLKSELQELGFRVLHPRRHAVIGARIKAMIGNRREIMGKIEQALAQRLREDGLQARIVSRIKSPYSIYRKMRGDHKTFAEVMDVYGVRVIVATVGECYRALGTAHGMYKPLENRFKDYIAIPKANGYQSLHTVLFGPAGAPIEVQIRTEDMDIVAERGVAAHWVYKSEASPANNAQMRAREWLQGLLDSQRQAGSSIEFLENVKVDLFPDEVYLFTPKGRILALPRNACAIDFAYAVHTDVGDHAVAARIDRALRPLRTRLVSGQTVEIVTAPSAAPQPQWLEFVVSSKARTAIRHYLKHLQHEDAVALGHRMLGRALADLGGTLDAVPEAALHAYLEENRLRRLEELLADIALGARMPALVARQLWRGDGGSGASPRDQVVRISGSERGVLSFGNCCMPIPGDPIIGFLSAGKGLVVHQTTCPNVIEMRKQPERVVRVDWDAEVSGDYRVQLRIEVANRPGVLATVAAAIAAANSNIENVEYLERDAHSASLLFTIEVRNREHLAEVMKRVRRADVVLVVHRQQS